MLPTLQRSFKMICRIFMIYVNKIIKKQFLNLLTCAWLLTRDTSVLSNVMAIDTFHG